MTQQFSLSILIDFRYQSIKITWLLSIFIDTDFQGRTIRKVIGGGGGGGGWGGELSSRKNFCSSSNSLYEFFLGQSINIF